MGQKKDELSGLLEYLKNKQYQLDRNSIKVWQKKITIENAERKTNAQELRVLGKRYYSFIKICNPGKRDS